MTNRHTVPNLSTAGCPEHIVPTLDRHLRGLSLLFFIRPPTSSCANECSFGTVESCACFCEHVWESQQVFTTFGSNVAVRLDILHRDKVVLRLMVTGRSGCGTMAMTEEMTQSGFL